jgi:hypothetical protein
MYEAAVPETNPNYADFPRQKKAMITRSAGGETPSKRFLHLMKRAPMWPPCKPLHGIVSGQCINSSP